MSIVRTVTAPTIWDRVICAVDLTPPASITAAKIAARLMPAIARLAICTVLSPDAIEGVPAL
jgi:hypothetical protein